MTTGTQKGIKAMDLRLAEQMVWSEMRHWGLGPEWVFKWDRARKRGGACQTFAGKPGGIIFLSRVLTPHRSAVEVQKTILHEIAHAIVGVNKGHGALWKAQMRKMGQQPNRCTEDLSGVVAKTAKYKLVCAQGEILGHASRKMNLDGRVCRTHRTMVFQVANNV